MKLGKNNQKKVNKSNEAKYLNINKTTDENQNAMNKRFNLNILFLLIILIIN